MRIEWRLAILLLLWSGLAAASDQVQLAPPGAWVKPVALPPLPAAGGASPVRVLLDDIQDDFASDDPEVYAETAAVIRTPQDLSKAGTVKLAWNPETDTVTVHKLHVLRGAETIDALAGGRSFTILRRETNLERAMLDGSLTATLQLEGLRVGDIIDMAYTLRRRDPVFQGRSELILGNLFGVPMAHLHIRAIWPEGRKMRWRETPGLDAPHVSTTPSGTEFVIDMTDTHTLEGPAGAPPRYWNLGQLEVTQFKDWAEVSALNWPLYEKAAVLQPGSPLEADLAKIRAASPDPGQRAAAALHLVQDNVRYVFQGMEGGYTPAAADLTWSRRFGDCKGKTALLLALLHALDIQAEPALVSTGLGDGLDARLPMLEWFNHILVRATIDGKTYWLDGTRSGDRDIKSLPIPPFHWALPVRRAGAALEPLVVPPLDKPDMETAMRIDASGGFDIPAPLHAERILRGDDAIGTRSNLANLSESDAEAALKQLWRNQYDWITVGTVSARYDEATGEEHLLMDGTAKLDFGTDPAGGERELRLDRATIDWMPDFRRDPGPAADAPFAIVYPSFGKSTETLLLPQTGQGFTIAGTDIDKTVAATEIRRRTRIDHGVVTMEKTVRAIAPEFPAAEGAAATATLRDLHDHLVYVRAPLGYRVPAHEAEALKSATPETEHDLISRGVDFSDRKDYDLAIADFTQAIERNPQSALAYADRGWAYIEKGDLDHAAADIDKALALDPHETAALDAEGKLLIAQKHYAGAIDAFTRSIALKPKDEFAYWQRGRAYRLAKEPDKALADLAEAIALMPERIDLMSLRADIMLSEHRDDEALAEADKAVALRPKNPSTHVIRAKVLAKLGRKDDALREYDASIAIKPTRSATLGRARLLGEAPPDSAHAAGDTAEEDTK